MKYFLDTASIDEAKRLVNKFPIKGVTTNPKLLCSENIDPLDVGTCFRIADELYELGINNVFFQIKNEEHLHEFINFILKKNIKKTSVVFKLTVNNEFYNMTRLIKENLNKLVKIAATTVYNIHQLNLAIESRVDFSMVYLSKNDNQDFIDRAVQLKKKHESDIGLVAASFRSTRDVATAINSGIEYATISPLILENSLNNSYTREEYNSLWG